MFASLVFAVIISVVDFFLEHDSALSIHTNVYLLTTLFEEKLSLFSMLLYTEIDMARFS